MKEAGIVENQMDLEFVIQLSWFLLDGGRMERDLEIIWILRLKILVLTHKDGLILHV